MMAEHAGQQRGKRVALASRANEMLSDWSSSVDPFGIVAPMAHAYVAWVSHPLELVDRLSQIGTDLLELQQHSFRRLAGVPEEDTVRPHPDDARFVDPVWSDTVSWSLLKQWYLALTHHVQDMLYDSPGLPAAQRRRAAFWWRHALNALAPTNFLVTNPVAQRIALETGGRSLQSGAAIALSDLAAGTVRMSSESDFVLGESVATTPGTVVMRNRLVEVIRYRPAGEHVIPEPLVLVAPWINKYYILDLNERKSLVRYLVEQGFDVFVTSWRNPDASMHQVRFDDYLLEGVHATIQAARSLTGASQVHAAGYCIGGTALTAYMAWANRRYSGDAVPVRDWTLFTTLVDFSAPGDIEVFIDDASVRQIVRDISRKGYLDGASMGMAFRMLRANSLIWHYVEKGWLCGEPPPAFDVMFWNMDTTRMPAAMHAWYLESLYLNNRLIQPGALRLAGESIDLGAIRQPLYAVATEDDHIAPWEQAFKVSQHVGSECDFVLSSSGHILGIINPPVTPPKRHYAHAEASRGVSAGAWRDLAKTTQGSWWPDWVQWLKARSGAPVQTNYVDDSDLGAAPGRYVHAR